MRASRPFKLPESQSTQSMQQHENQIGLGVLSPPLVKGLSVLQQFVDGLRNLWPSLFQPLYKAATEMLRLEIELKRCQSLLLHRRFQRRTNSEAQQEQVGDTKATEIEAEEPQAEVHKDEKTESAPSDKKNLDEKENNLNKLVSVRNEVKDEFLRAANKFLEEAKTLEDSNVEQQMEEWIAGLNSILQSDEAQQVNRQLSQYEENSSDEKEQEEQMKLEADQEEEKKSDETEAVLKTACDALEKVIEWQKKANDNPFYKQRLHAIERTEENALRLSVTLQAFSRLLLDRNALAWPAMLWDESKSRDHEEDNDDKKNDASVAQKLMEHVQQFNKSVAQEQQFSQQVKQLVRSFPLQDVLSAVQQISPWLWQCVQELGVVRKTVQQMQPMIAELHRLKQQQQDGSPNIASLHSLQNQLKQLKKDIRQVHRQREDQEEDEGHGTPRSRTELETREKELRQQLRQCEREYETQLGQLALEAFNHFPELLLQYKELAAFVDQDGLEREHRSLSQYEEKETLSAPPESRHLVLKAKLDGEWVVLKRFDVKNPTGRHALMKEVRLLKRLQHPCIAEVRCVFWEKSTHGTHAFVEMPFYDGGDLQ